MMDSNMRRAAGSAAVLAVAAGLAVAAFPGTASGASGTVTWTDGNSKFTRTVSDTTPIAGETITVTTMFERTGIPVEYIYSVKDAHPTCLTPVAGSGKMGGDQVSLDTSAPDSVSASFSVVKYPVYPNISPKSQTFEVQYTVGVNCARDTPLSTSMSYNGSLGAGNYTDKGPSLTVSSDANSTTTLAPVSGAKVNTPTTLTATVSPAAAGGTIQFNAGDQVLGTIPVAANGTASIGWTPGAAGNYNITATFSGRTGVSGSTTTQAVTVADVTTTPTTTPKPSTGSF
ncbi:Ig-like domain-containing protein [Nocardia sp. NBC_00511]|uniref:Ig-like domain-containing protein n=1 Tax=Nocardia sp. NBC_00511 TaxID=2903591 RepID=UPI0030DFB735